MPYLESPHHNPHGKGVWHCDCGAERCGTIVECRQCGCDICNECAPSDFVPLQDEYCVECLPKVCTYCREYHETSKQRPYEPPSVVLCDDCTFYCSECGAMDAECAKGKDICIECDEGREFL